MLQRDKEKNISFLQFKSPPQKRSQRFFSHQGSSKGSFLTFLNNRVPLEKMPFLEKFSAYSVRVEKKDA
jgi:hypothetical protein